MTSTRIRNFRFYPVISCSNVSICRSSPVTVNEFVIYFYASIFFSNSNFLRKTRFDIFNFFNCSVRDCHSFDKRYFWRLLKSLSVARRRRRRCFLAKMTSPQYFSNLLTRSETRQKLFFSCFSDRWGRRRGKRKVWGTRTRRRRSDLDIPKCA